MLWESHTDDTVVLRPFGQLASWPSDDAPHPEGAWHCEAVGKGLSSRLRFIVQERKLEPFLARRRQYSRDLMVGPPRDSVEVSELFVIALEGTHARPFHSGPANVHVVGLSHLFTTEPPAAAQQRLENDQDELQERAQAERERPSWVSTARALPGALTPAQRDLVTEAATGLPVPVGTREARESALARSTRARASLCPPRSTCRGSASASAVAPRRRPQVSPPLWLLTLDSRAL